MQGIAGSKRLALSMQGRSERGGERERENVEELGFRAGEGGRKE